MTEEAHLTSLIEGQSAQVEAAADAAIATLESLSRELPAEQSVRQNLASTYFRAGEMLTGAGRTPRSVGKAVDHYRRSHALFQLMQAGSPDDQRLRQVGLEVQVALAAALAMAGENREAERTIGEALGRAAELRASDPKNATLVVGYLSARVQAAT